MFRNLLGLRTPTFCSNMCNLDGWVWRRYYTQQKAIDNMSGNQLKDDLKRRDREGKERQAEAQMLDSLYQVRGLHTEPR